MKKILAVVLALAMIFSFAVIGSAREVMVEEREIATFGPKDYKILAKPGEEATFVVEWKAALDEWNKTVDPDMGEEPLEFDKDGTIVIPFYVQPNDVSMSPLQKVELTDAAKAAGATLTDETAEIMGDDSEEMRAMYFVGTVTLPASYLFTTEALDVLNVTVAVSDQWVIGEYSGIAETPIDITFNVAEMGMTGMPVTVVSADGTEAYVYNVTLGGGSVTIDGKPYEPTKKELRKEWWRKLAVKILEFNNRIIAWLMNGPLAPAPWNVVK